MKGAFLIPFITCLFVIGMPCMYLELAMGQYFASGNISIWNKINPYMKGVGYTICIINLLMLAYYNTLQAYALYYLAFSFSSPVPWSRCDKEWNTQYCKTNDLLKMRNLSILNNDTMSSEEFFKNKLLGVNLSRGFDDLNGIKFDILICLAIIFILTTLCLVGGIKTSGKAIYVTALLPYVCLVVLIVQSLRLEGSWNGLRAFVTPKFDSLLKIEVWLAAAIQVFFSLGPGFGVLTTYSSYAPKDTNIKNLTIICSLINCGTSLLYGVVVFAGIGYMVLISSSYYYFSSNVV
jgi:solute carrier family 6 (neurotransmitter transporter, serotonin) member 4